MSSAIEPTTKGDAVSTPTTRSRGLGALLARLAAAYSSNNPKDIAIAQDLLVGGLQTEKNINWQRVEAQKNAELAEMSEKSPAVDTKRKMGGEVSEAEIGVPGMKVEIEPKVEEEMETEIKSENENGKSTSTPKPAKTGGCCGCGDCDEFKEKNQPQSG